MRKLGEILDMVQKGQKPEYDELRFALETMRNLSSFDLMALQKLASAENEGKKPILGSSAMWQFGERMNRNKKAYEKSPDEWLGWDNNPDNPEYQKRIATSQKIFQHFLNKVNHERS